MRGEKKGKINSSCGEKSIIFFFPLLSPADLLFSSANNQQESFLVHVLPAGNQAQAVMSVCVKGEAKKRACTSHQAPPLNYQLLGSQGF